MDLAQRSDKFEVPTLPSTMLHREGLVHALTEAIESHSASQSSHHKLVLLCAPAGYGKTTLLVDTVSQLSGAYCWYILNSSDADPELFLQRLLISIRRSLSAFAISFAPWLEKSYADLNAHDDATSSLLARIDLLIDALQNDIAMPFALIFCNYHEIQQNTNINQIIDHLIANVPQRGVIVIESRAMPDLALVTLIAHRQMFGLGSQRLRFTPLEIYELGHLQGITALSLHESEQIAQKSEGWIAGILLSSRLGHSSFHTSAPVQEESWEESETNGDNAQILSYITYEVFKNETNTYQFLEQTSILTQLTPEHCNALLEINNAAVQLSYAEQRGLFVIHNKRKSELGQAKLYTCHPLLRQLLVEHLHQSSPMLYQTLQSRAAHILLADHQHEQALTHACQALEYDFATSIILEMASTFIYEEQSQVMLHWLKLLPETIFQQHAQLLLMASNIYLRLGDFSLVAPLLDKAELLLNSHPSIHDPLQLMMIQADLKIARAHLMFFQGEFQSTQDLCQQALVLLPPDERKLHIRAYQYLGIALIVGVGQIQEGIAQLQFALQMSRSQQNERQTATLHRLVANAYSWVGNHALAEHHQTRSLQIWDKLNNSQGIIYCLTSMGLLKMRQGLYPQAEEILNRALQQARITSQFKNNEAYILLAFGDFHNSQGKYVQALYELEDSLNLARDCSDHYLTCCVLCSIALAYIFMGDTPTAQLFLDQIIFKTDTKGSYENGLSLLTQGTVYLAQQNYEQAEPILQQTTNLVKQTNIQVLYISALLRLAVCYLRQDKKRPALQTGKQIIELNKKGDFDSFIQVELGRYSELKPMLDQAAAVDLSPQLVITTEQIEQNPPFQTEVQLPMEPDQPEVIPVQIMALGEPKVLLQGIPVTRWRMARAMELFFLLLENGRPMRKEQIITILWPDHDTDQINSTVRTTIYYLRKAFGDHSITFQSGLYSLNLSAIGGTNIWYDVEIFNEQYKQAKKALENKQDDAAFTAFTQMTNLYNGDYVQSFYSDWCILRRDKLRQIYIDAHHQLAQIAWRKEDWKDSLQHWQHLLTLDSCDERAHYGIMHCYLQQNKREMALRQFQRCSQNLQEELQTTPGSALQKLYRSIAE
jgi:LuxR family transcriptional regulator, maltose regulon positive regulatory protein